MALYAALTAGIGSYYARYIEPRMLSVSYHTIYSPLIPKGFDGVKLVQFSDLHLGYHYSLTQLSKVVEKINSEDPDIVFFTGDLVDDLQTYNEITHISPILQTIRAPLGKFSIYGNHDHGGYGTQVYRNLMKQAGFQLLQNQETRIQLLDGSQLSILGIDDMLLGRPQIEQTVQKSLPDIYTIVLVHEPDIAPLIANYPVDLQLSGHSHGGQIQIPLIGPIVTPPLAQQYIEGFYTINRQMEGDLTVYVNRGLGTTRIPFRFLAKPEITVFTLKRG
jgi:predicted MPP superfamily phosphohydrolase